MPDDFVKTQLAKSHKLLDSVHKFQSSAGGPLPSYSMARQARADSGQAPKTNIGSELAAKSSNIDNYVKGTNPQ